jgi:hypothetical protein
VGHRPDIFTVVKVKEKTVTNKKIIGIALILMVIVIGTVFANVNCRFHNNSSKTITVSVQGERFTLKPGQDKSISLPKDVYDLYYTENDTVGHTFVMGNFVRFYDL